MSLSAVAEEPTAKEQSEEIQFHRFYVGISGGYSSGLETCSALGSDFTVGKCSENNLGGKIFTGFRFTRHLGLELAVMALGSSEAKGEWFGRQEEASVFAEGAELSGTGTLPLSESFDVFAKAGVLWWSVGTDLPDDFSLSDDGLSPGLGAGIHYGLTENFGMRLEWQRFFAVGGNLTGGEFDIDLFTAGIVLGF